MHDARRTAHRPHADSAPQPARRPERQAQGVERHARASADYTLAAVATVESDVRDARRAMALRASLGARQERDAQGAAPAHRQASCAVACARQRVQLPLLRAHRRCLRRCGCHCHRCCWRAVGQPGSALHHAAADGRRRRRRVSRDHADCGWRMCCPASCIPRVPLRAWPRVAAGGSGAVGRAHTHSWRGEPSRGGEYPYAGANPKDCYPYPVCIRACRRSTSSAASSASVMRRGLHSGMGQQKC